MNDYKEMLRKSGISMNNNVTVIDLPDMRDDIFNNNGPTLWIVCMDNRLPAWLNTFVKGDDVIVGIQAADALESKNTIKDTLLDQSLGLRNIKIVTHYDPAHPCDCAGNKNLFEEINKSPKLASRELEESIRTYAHLGHGTPGTFEAAMPGAIAKEVQKILVMAEKEAAHPLGIKSLEAYRVPVKERNASQKQGLDLVITTALKGGYKALPEGLTTDLGKHFIISANYFDGIWPSMKLILSKGIVSSIMLAPQSDGEEKNMRENLGPKVRSFVRESGYRVGKAAGELDITVLPAKTAVTDKPSNARVRLKSA